MNRLIQSILAVAAGTLLLVAPLRAQPDHAPPRDDRPRGQRPDDQRPRESRRQVAGEIFFSALRDLNLNDSQRKNVREILRDARDQLRQAMADTENAAPAERRAAFEAVIKDIQSRIEAELGEDQVRVFREKINEVRKQLAPQSPQPPGPLALFQTIVGKLDLADEQKAEVDKLLADVRSGFEALALNAAGTDPQVMREDARQLMRDAREKLAEILRPEQRRQMRELMRDAMRNGGFARARERLGRDGPPGDRPNRGRPGGDRPPPPRDEPPTDENAPPPPPEAFNLQPSEDPAASSGRSSSDEKRLAVGDPLPDFVYKRVDGKTFDSARFRGEPIVLMFGSYTSPAFRDNAPAFERLESQLGRRARLEIIYTAEAHPAGEWEVQRNIDEKISVKRHETEADRLAAARLAVEKLGLKADVLIEPMGEPLSTALNAAPNGAIVVARDGKILSIQRWFDPHRTERELRSALQQKPG